MAESCQKEQPLHKIKCLNYAKEYIEKSEAFWNNVLWTDKTQTELWATTKEGIFGEKRVNPL